MTSNVGRPLDGWVGRSRYAEENRQGGVPPEPLIRRSRWPEALGREGLSRFGDGCLPWRSRQEPGARLSNQARGPRRLLPTVGQGADRGGVQPRSRCWRRAWARCAVLIKALLSRCFLIWHFHAEPIFCRLGRRLATGLVQQTVQIAAAHDLTLFVSEHFLLRFRPRQPLLPRSEGHLPSNRRLRQLDFALVDSG